MDQKDLEHIEALVALKNWGEAKKAVLAELYENPDDTRALTLMGVILTEQGDQVGALKALSYCMSLGIRDADVLEAAGCAYLRLKDYPQAGLLLEEARQVDGLSASIMRNLGVLYSQTGRAKECKQAFLRSRELNPSDTLTLYALASIQLYYGELEEARQTLNDLVTLDPPEELKRFAIESLEKLSHMRF